MQSPIALPDLIAARAAASPDGVAVESVEHGPVTWGDLDREGRRWAAALRRLGVQAGDRVVTLMPNSPEGFHVWNAVAALRAVEVPANTSYRGAWLAHVLDNAQASVVVTAARFLEQVEAVLEGTPVKTVVVYDTEEPASGAVEAVGGPAFLGDVEPVDWEPLGAHDTACVVYTSGTTGRSKGVVIPWRQFEERVVSDIIPADRRVGDVYYSPFAPYHVTGKAPLYNAAYEGTSVVIREEFKTDEFWSDIRRYGCTSTLVVGAMANFLYSQPPQPDDADSPLRNVLMAPLIPEVDGFRERFGVDVYTAYSMTEITLPFISAGKYEVGNDNWRSCGKRNDRLEVRIVDEHDEEVPVGQVGELIVRGEPWTLNAGYLGMPEASFAAWRNGWFHTGDAFMVDEDGFYYFVDRVKDAIRRRGENISSFEVEAAVNQHPDVLESAAVAVPSEWGEDEVKVAVVPMPGTTLDPAALIEFLIPIMPRFAVPRYIEVMAELPKTPTFRVQKAKIREAGVTDTTWDREAAGVVVPKQGAKKT